MGLPRVKDDPRVVSGTKPGRRLWDLQPARKRAGLEDMRIHDLRTLYLACLGAWRGTSDDRQAFGHTQVQTTGRADRLAIVFDPERLEQLGDHVELTGAGGSRHPLMAKFRIRKSGKEFFFVANHLQRGKEEIRQTQARWLNDWAEKDDSAIVLAGDFNFDVDPATREGNRAYKLFLERDVFKWVEPKCLSAGTCPSTGTQCNPKYNSILDFVFLAGAAKDWTGGAIILFAEEPDYCANPSLTRDFESSYNSGG